jgi:hypothetical protein
MQLTNLAQTKISIISGILSNRTRVLAECLQSAEPVGLRNYMGFEEERTPKKERKSAKTS